MGITLNTKASVLKGKKITAILGTCYHRRLISIWLLLELKDNAFEREMGMLLCAHKPSTQQLMQEEGCVLSANLYDIISSRLALAS